MNLSDYNDIKARDTINIGSDLDDLFDDYDGNLINYFCGMTPSESRTFEKRLKEAYKK